MKKQKKIDEPLVCSGCGAGEPQDECMDGWHTIIRVWKEGQTSFTYCPTCYGRNYGKPIEEHDGSTVH